MVRIRPSKLFLSDIAKEKMFKKIAGYWIKRMPIGSMNKSDDLVQECYIIDILSLKKYDPNSGVPQHLYSFRAINWHLSNLCAKEWENRLPITDIDCMEEICCNSPSPEHQAFIMEIVDRIGAECPGIADMILNGIPVELFRIVRAQQRIKNSKFGKSQLNSVFKLKKNHIEEYFGINFSKLAEKFYYMYR